MPGSRLQISLASRSRQRAAISGSRPMRAASEAAARRAGRRGDGWLPGGSLTAEGRKALWELVKSTAEQAGRDPGAIDYTRMGSLEMTPEEAEQLGTQGVTRIVVGAPAGEPDEQCAQLVEFAERFGLGKG
jgi:alkanesulfonate monooxygenase SsuD/methylene tetrahydromethanopterin reductase-like flavin-dependent oxidoreductase (luciferase family)